MVEFNLFVEQLFIYGILKRIKINTLNIINNKKSSTFLKIKFFCYYILMIISSFILRFIICSDYIEL